MEDISTSLCTWPQSLFVLSVGMKHGCNCFWLASYEGCCVTVFLFSLQHFRQALNDSNKCSLSKAQSKSPVIFPDDHITTSSLSLLPLESVLHNVRLQMSTVHFHIIQTSFLNINWMPLYLLSPVHVFMNKDETFKYFMEMLLLQ